LNGYTTVQLHTSFQPTVNNTAGAALSIQPSSAASTGYLITADNATGANKFYVDYQGNAYSAGTLAIGTSNVPATDAIDALNGNIVATANNGFGTTLGLYHGLGSLPGYPTSNYPTLKTDYTYLYISVAGNYSSYIDGGGGYNISGNGSFNIFGSGTYNGNGSGLTNLNASNLASGTVPDAELSANVVMVGGTQTISGAKTFSGGLTVSAGGANITGQTSVSGSTTGPIFSATNTSAGNGYGVEGVMNSATNTGSAVMGINNGTSGASYGGYFSTLSTGGTTVYANAGSTTGTTYAGYFLNNSSGGYGVYAQTTNAADTAYAGFFTSNSTVNGAVSLYAAMTGGGGGYSYALMGNNSSSTSNSVGVAGYATGSTGGTYGVWGENNSTGGTAVRADEFGASGTTYGIAANVSSPNGYSGYFSGGLGVNIVNGGLTVTAGGANITGFITQTTAVGSTYIYQNNATAGQYVGLVLEETGTQKWFAGKEGSTNNFVISDVSGTSVNVAQFGNGTGASNTFNRNTTFNNNLYTLGNMGVGTTGPGAQLDVQNSSGAASMRIKATTANNSALLNIDRAGSGGGVASQISLLTSGSNDWGIGTQQGSGTGASDLGIYNYGTASGALYIQKSNNYVGIGKTTPGAQLHVKSSATPALVVETTAAAGTGSNYILFNDAAGNKGYVGYGSSSNDGIYLATYRNASVSLLSNNGNGNLTVNPSGDILSNGNTVIDAGGGWHRSYGNAGWYNGTYCGGWYMADTTWIRSYCSKNVYVDQQVRADGGFVGSIDGLNSGSQCVGASVAMYAGVATYGWITSSDRRIKKDIQDSDLGLEFINKLRPVSYRLKKDPAHRNKKLYGLIAQEVIEAVKMKDFGAVEGGENGKMYALNYNEFIAPLIKAVQELTGKISKHDERISRLEKQVEKLNQDLCKRMPASEAASSGCGVKTEGK
jgi:hypothetical protein